MRNPSVRVAALHAVLVAATACTVEADLPPCAPADELAARKVVFLDPPSDVTIDEGLAMYEGQAILHVGCGGGAFCHSARARGMARVSTPHGLDFDLVPPCRGIACPTDDRDLARFARHHTRVVGRARELYGWMKAGDMPPGAVGRAVVRRSGTARDGAGVEVPSITSPEGEAIVARWLACGAPVVEVSGVPDLAHPAGSACDASTSLGDCVTGAAVDPADYAIAPTWSALYPALIGPLCGESCHGGDAPRTGEPRLDDIDRAYRAIRFGDDDGLALVDPADPRGSGLVLMLTTGDPELPRMPPAFREGTLPPEVIDRVVAWIAAGGPR